MTTPDKSARGKGPTGKGPLGRGVPIINQEQARLDFGLTAYALLRAVERGQLDPLQVNGEGRAYYSVRQLRELRKRLTNSYSTLPNAA